MPGTLALQKRRRAVSARTCHFRDPQDPCRSSPNHHAKRLRVQTAPTPSLQREKRRLSPLPDARRRLLDAVRRRRGPADAAPARPQRHAGGVAEAAPGSHADSAHPVPLPVGLVPAGTLLLERVLPNGRTSRRVGRLAAAGAHPGVHLPRPDRESQR